MESPRWLVRSWVELSPITSRGGGAVSNVTRLDQWDRRLTRGTVYINLPIGALAFAVIVVFFNSPQRKAEAKVTWKERTNQLDLWGTAVFLPAIVSLLLALQWGGSKYPWSNGRIIALFVVFGVLIAIFIGVQVWKGDNATVPFKIISQRSMAGSTWFAFCAGGCFFAVLYWLPIWFQAIKNTTATKSGIDTMPMIIALVLSMLGSGVGTTVSGYYTPFIMMSTVITAIGTGLLTTFQVDTGHSKWIGYQVIFGAGLGLGMQVSRSCPPVLSWLTCSRKLLSAPKQSYPSPTFLWGQQ